MHLVSELAVLTATMLIGTAVPAHADPPQPAEIGAAAAQLAALPSQGGAPAALALPRFTIYPPDSEPSTRGIGPRVNSMHTVRATHFRVWAGYDLDLRLHPYTSGIGPCPEGANGTGCNRLIGKVIQPSRYERHPFAD